MNDRSSKDKKLNCPITQGVDFENRPLSADEYLAWVQYNWEHCVDRKAYREQRKQMVVNAPFFI